MKKIIFLLLFLMTVTGCRDQSLQNWARDIEAKKREAITQSLVVPYRQAQHEAFRNYFRALTEMAYQLKTDNGFRIKFKASLRGVDLNRYYERVFISEANWQTILQGCTKNRFFLCAEEVRSLEEVKRVFEEAVR